MSTVWNGSGTAVSTTAGAATRLAIVSSTDASPIVVTTGTHGYHTGDTIEIEGHATNTAANGQWQITVQSTTTFVLNGSTGNGVGGATGYSINYELLPALQMPANGVVADVNDVITLGQGLSNVAPFLYRRSGKWRIYNEYSFAGLGDLITYPYVSNPWSANANFQGSQASSSRAALASTTTTFQSASITPSLAPDFASTDILAVHLQCTAMPVIHTGTENYWAEVGFGLVQGGTLYPVLGMSQVVGGGYAETAGNIVRSVTLTGLVYFSGFGGTLPTSALSFAIYGRVDWPTTAVNTVDLQLIGQAGGYALQLRPN
jgi:hypothetical protein